MKKTAMKRRILSFALALVLTLCLSGMTAYGAPVDYPYITMDDSADFTIVTTEGLTIQDLVVVGLDGSYVKHAFTSEEWPYITWNSSDEDVAEVEVDASRADTADITAVGAGTAVVTVTYDSPTADPVSVTCYVAVEPSVHEIDITVDGNYSYDDFSYEDLNIPMFNLDIVYNNIGYDDDDVLKMNQTALHALLYALQYKQNGETVFDVNDPANWAWVRDNVTLNSEGSYVAAIGADSWSWEYKVNNVSPQYAASIYKLTDGNAVDWDF